MAMFTFIGSHKYKKEGVGGVLLPEGGWSKARKSDLVNWFSGAYI